MADVAKNSLVIRGLRRVVTLFSGVERVVTLFSGVEKVFSEEIWTCLFAIVSVVL